jgi:hypothetical protein
MLIFILLLLFLIIFCYVVYITVLSKVRQVLREEDVSSYSNDMDDSLSLHLSRRFLLQKENERLLPLTRRLCRVDS